MSETGGLETIALEREPGIQILSLRHFSWVDFFMAIERCEIRPAEWPERRAIAELLAICRSRFQLPLNSYSHSPIELWLSGAVRIEDMALCKLETPKPTPAEPAEPSTQLRTIKERLCLCAYR